MSLPTKVGRNERPRRGSARDAIVDAAVELFDRQGYETTSVQQVVERAGVTKGSFYHHFSSKEAVLLVIHDTFMDHQLDILDSIVGRDRPVADNLAELIEEIVVGVEAFQAHQRIFYEQYRFFSGPGFATVEQKRNEFERRVVRLIGRGIEAGELRPVESARVLAFGLVGMSAWTYHWYHPGPMSAREIGRLYARTFLEGVLA